MRTKSTKLSDAETGAIVKAFMQDDLATAYDAVPHLAKGVVEAKLRDLQLLRPSATDEGDIADFVEAVKATEHPWLAAEAAIAALQPFVDAHAAELAQHVPHPKAKG